MWKLEIARDGQEPTVFEDVSLAYEHHRKAPGAPIHEVLVAYSSIKEVLAALRSYNVIGGRLLPEFTDTGFKVYGRSGTLTPKQTSSAPVQEYIGWDDGELESWELTVYQPE